MLRERPHRLLARVLLLSLVWSGCAASPRSQEPCGYSGGCGAVRQQWRQRTALQQQRGVGAEGHARPDWKGAPARGAPEDEERWERIEKRLDVYFAWALVRWEETARMRLRALDSRHLLTEHPLRTQSLDALTHAVLNWSVDHAWDEDLFRKHPNEVALYLLARNSALATAVELGRYAPPHLDYMPPPDTRPAPEELAIEVLAGMVPLVGEATDMGGLLFGYSITGRELDADERLLCALGMLVPLVPGRALSGGGEILERTALATGRSLNEVRVLQHVASHLSPGEAAQVEALVRKATKGGALSEEEVAFLRRVAAGLERPLAEAAETLRRGGKVPLVGSRLGREGLRLEPGTAEHMAAAWVDYQFRHFGKSPRFRFDIDEGWRKKYELILKNKEKGGAFEREVLRHVGQEKNHALMMPPPDVDWPGFIPDGVRHSPTPGELVWGRPYNFIETKARKELALTGNLKAMLDYIEEYGGTVELWIRSARHPEGATRLTKPLRDRLVDLATKGLVNIKSFP